MKTISFTVSVSGLQYTLVYKEVRSYWKQNMIERVPNYSNQSRPIEHEHNQTYRSSMHVFHWVMLDG